MEQPIDGNRLSGGRANLVRGRWHEIESKEREGAELGLLSLAVPSKGGFLQGESTWALCRNPCGKRGWRFSTTGHQRPSAISQTLAIR
jgi:hypothetical protein